MPIELKFETIKRKALEEYYNRVGSLKHGIFGSEGAPFLALVGQIEQLNSTGKSRPATDILEEWQDYGQKIIEEWDVRCVGKLAELFPSCVPAYWKGQRLLAYMADNENCDWMVGPGLAA